MQQHQITDYKLGYLINSFWDLRNKVIHGKIEITTDRLNKAIRARGSKSLIELHNYVTADIKRDNYPDDFYLTGDRSL